VVHGNSLNVILDPKHIVFNRIQAQLLAIGPVTAWITNTRRRTTELGKCTSLAKEIMGAYNFTSAHKFCKMRDFQPNFLFLKKLTKFFLQAKINMEKDYPTVTMPLTHIIISV